MQVTYSIEVKLVQELEIMISLYLLCIVTHNFFNNESMKNVIHL